MSPRPEVLAPAGSPEALTAAVRCGADADGLPIGMQLIGKAYCEETLFSLARIFEREAAV